MKTRLLLLLDIVFVFSRRLPARTNLRLKRHLLGTLRLPPTASRRRSSRTLRTRTFYLTSPTSTSEPEQREHLCLLLRLLFPCVILPPILLVSRTPPKSPSSSRRRQSRQSRNRRSKILSPCSRLRHRSQKTSRTCIRRR